MAQQPNTLIVTGPNLQQVDAGTQQIQPTGATTQATLADMLGSPLGTAVYYFTGTPAATNQTFFVAARAQRIRLIAIQCVFSVAAGGTSTLDVTLDSGTQAPGAGTAITSPSFNLNATANTPQTGVFASPPILMNAGDRLAVKFNNTIQSTAGLVVSVQLGIP